jgi:membrane fusion protein, multidrug efflux system
MKTRLLKAAGPSTGLSLALIFGLTVLLPGCSQERAGSASAVGVPADSVRALDVLVVAPGLDASDIFTTYLQPMVDAPAIARHRGVVRAVAVVEGQRVAAGQVLANMEDDEQRLDREKTGALADQAAAEYDRAQKAAAGNLISRHELEVARAKDQAARAEAERAKLDFDRCTVRAPIAGVVRLVRVEPNALVEEDEILFRVAVADRLKADLYLPAEVRSQFKVGDSIPVVPVSDLGGRPSRGRVSLVNPVVDPITGLFHVQIEVPPGSGMAPGADVRVVPSGSSGAGAPTASALGGAVLPRGVYVEREGDRLLVYKVVGGTARRTPVDLGAPGADGFAVLSGLRPGDLVMAAGQTPPRDGMPVAPRVGSTR